MDIPTLWVRCHPPLLRYLKRLTQNTAEAEDLAQITFVRAMEHAGRVAEMDEAHAEAWLRRTAHNAFIDELRKRRRQAPLDDARIPAYEEDFSAVHVEQLMDTLPPKLSEVVRLRHLQGYTSAQIGALLRLPPATVRTRLRAAMILLKGQEASLTTQNKGGTKP